MANEKKNLSHLNMSDAELFAKVDHTALESEKITAPRYSYWKSVFRVFFRKKINSIILSILAILLAFTYIYPNLHTFIPSVDKYDRYEQMGNDNVVHLSPTQAIERHGFALKWVLGSGSSGESTFDAIWVGAEISVTLALICALINMTIGVLIGAVWGFSRKVDVVMTEVYNIIANVPMILLVSVLMLILKPSFWTMVVALTVTGWLGIAFFIRTQVIIIRDREYNLASKCLGTPIMRIATKNILPFMTSVIVTMAAVEIPSYISYEVFLSYIGMGLSDFSLGKLINEAKSSMLVPGWSFEFWSPVAIAAIITVVLYVVGQNLGDASDPRTHM